MSSNPSLGSQPPNQPVGAPKLLNYEEIIQRGIIQSPAAQNLKFTNASLNLTVSKILTLKDEEVVDEYQIPPRGMVLVVTEEIFKMPDDVLGYTTVKNGLSLKGIMGVNIGIVDNEWNAPISSLLINFGDRPFPIKKGDVCLRMTFHEFTIPQRPVKSIFTPLTQAQYLQMRNTEARGYLANTFLVIDKVKKEIRKKVIVSFWKYIGIVGGILAILAFLFTYIQDVTDKGNYSKDYLQYRNNIDTYLEVKTLTSKLDSMAKVGNELMSKYESLEKRLAGREGEQSEQSTKVQTNNRGEKKGKQKAE